jgi:hypothetical protein
MPDKNGDSKLKSTLLVCTTLIAFASLVLNVVQYRSSRQTQTFETLSMYPSVNTFRLRLSLVDIERIRSLAQEGVEFVYFPNPSFLLDDRLRNIDDESATVQFLVIMNNGDVALSNLRLAQTNASLPVLSASHLAPHSTLLIPETVYKSTQTAESISSIFQASFDFSLGGNRLSDNVVISPPSDEVVVFEVGLGAIRRSSFDFEDQ